MVHASLFVTSDSVWLFFCVFSPELKGKLSVSEMITSFLQLHACIHLCTGLCWQVLKYQMWLIVLQIMHVKYWIHLVLLNYLAELDRAAALSSKLLAALPAHVTSQSFPSHILVQIVAINIFSMHHAQRMTQYQDGEEHADSFNEELGSEELRSFSLMFSFTSKCYVRMMRMICLPECKAL